MCQHPKLKQSMNLFFKAVLQRDLDVYVGYVGLFTKGICGSTKSATLPPPKLISSVIHKL